MSTAYSIEQVKAAKAIAISRTPNAVQARVETHNAMGIKHDPAIAVLVRCPVQKRAGWQSVGYISDLLGGAA